MSHKMPPLFFAFLFAAAAARADYLEFTVALPRAGAEAPLLRDIRALIVRPDGTGALHPAFHDKDATWKIRVRPVLPGRWKLCEVLEFSKDGETSKPLALAPASAPQMLTCDRSNLSTVSPVAIDPRNARSFAFADARPYYPLGMNTGWSTGVLSFGKIFSGMQSAGLNWARIWMAHWDMMNLDWLPAHAGRPSPKPGNVDEEAARNWDAVVAFAEKHGVWFQLVLQHHGQYSLTNDSNWDANPWNKANGGFLAAPQDFFTSPEAIRHTKAKYRYIIARYGHSPAILAWELFNEAHWTAPMAMGRDDILGAWHAGMAAFIRANDPYRHLVTTSHDDLRSPVYAAMDFLQPHLYAVNMLAHTRRFAFAPQTPERPLFYGEIGEDHLPVTAAQKASGETLAPIVWPTLFAGGGALPGQTWSWDKLLGTPRLAEMRARGAYIAAARLPERNTGMAAFSAAVACDATVPRVITAGHSWAVNPAGAVTIPDDDRDTPALADIPRYYIADPRHLALGFKRSFDINFTKTTGAGSPVTITLAGLAHEGGALRVLVDGKVAHERAWEPGPREIADKPCQIPLPLPAGAHTLTLENTGDPATGRISSFRLVSIDLTGRMSALAACGLRSPDSSCVLLYIWHRGNIFSEKPGPAASGDVPIENLPAGKWTAAWWDMLGGGAASVENLTHAGGALTLRTPEIPRHAAVILERK
jgi:hypothetical protein